VLLSCKLSLKSARACVVGASALLVCQPDILLVDCMMRCKLAVPSTAMVCRLPSWLLQCNNVSALRIKPANWRKPERLSCHTDRRTVRALA
jgi:hypothetical protein